jgi:membrane-associated phospholipid phosphatase
MRKVITFAVVGVLGFVVASQLDFVLLGTDKLRETDLSRLARVTGYLPVWLLVAGALWLLRQKREALWLALGPTAAGIVGEGLKLVLRRGRPAGDVYQWLPWSWSTAGIGLPSSHAIVAFGATWMLCRLYPRAWPVWLFAGVACAAQRVLWRAHFVSDVFLSAVVAYAVVWLLWRNKRCAGADNS